MWLTLMLGCPPAGESGKGVEPADTMNTVESAGDSGCAAGTEICDGVDNDCDGVVDEEAADAQLVYVDGDGDGYGDDATGTMGCAAPGGYVAVGGDCEDSNPAVNPGAEICQDGVDQSCGAGREACRRTGEWHVEDADFKVEEESFRSWIFAYGTGDVDGDGRNEVVFSGGTEETPGNFVRQLYFMHGDALVGNLADAPIKMRGWGDWETPVPRMLGDIDQDGREDMLVMSGYRMHVVREIRDAVLLEDVAVEVTDREFYFRDDDEPVGDVTGDGKLDLCVVPFFNSPYQVVGFADFTNIEQEQTDYSFAIHLSEDDWTVHNGSKDVNGDGINDLVVSMRTRSIGAREGGGVYVFRGPVEGEMVEEDADATFIGEHEMDYAGDTMVPAGDLNGDGYGEIAIGVPGDDHNGSEAGAVYVVSGVSEGSIPLSLAESVFYGETENDGLTGCLWADGDLDGDQRDDFLVSYYGFDYIHFTYGFYNIVIGENLLSNGDFSIEGASLCKSIGDINNDNIQDFTYNHQTSEWNQSFNGTSYFFLGYGI